MKKIISIVASVVLAFLPACAQQARPTVAVLGDSYSTFEGFIPKENEVWYHAKPNLELTDVAKVEQTWWWQVIKEGGYKMGLINSYSGATVCNTGYDDRDFTDRSFVTRALNLGTPDIILICGGTNDSWAKVKMGGYLYDGWKRADLFYFRPAMAKMLDEVGRHYPNADVYFILNTQLSDDINTSVKEVCRHYGVPVVQLKEIDKKHGHPTVKGMRSIADQVLAAIRNNSKR